jgi:hypothetical protein
MGMGRTESSESFNVSPEKLSLAQAAFREFHTLCFWFMRPDTELVAEDVPYICERLRADGGRRGFEIAAKICR